MHDDLDTKDNISPRYSSEVIVRLLQIEVGEVLAFAAAIARRTGLGLSEMAALEHFQHSHGAHADGVGQAPELGCDHGARGSSRAAMHSADPTPPTAAAWWCFRSPRASGRPDATSFRRRSGCWRRPPSSRTRSAPRLASTSRLQPRSSGATRGGSLAAIQGARGRILGRKDQRYRPEVRREWTAVPSW